MEMTSRINELNNIKKKLNVPKNRNGAYRNKYRSCDDIFDKLNPILINEGCNLLLKNDILYSQYPSSTTTKYDREGRTSETVTTSGCANMKVTAQLFNKDGKIITETTGFAQIGTEKTGLDASQSTGSATTYATKIALCNMFCLGSTGIDPDSIHDTGIDNDEYRRILNEVEDATNVKELEETAKSIKTQEHLSQQQRNYLRRIYRFKMEELSKNSNSIMPKAANEEDNSGALKAPSDLLKSITPKAENDNNNTLKAPADLFRK